MRIRVAAAAGGAPVDLSRVNGILSLAAGASPVTLVPKAIPSADIDYSSGAATIFVPASTGTFIKAFLGPATPTD